MRSNTGNLLLDYIPTEVLLYILSFLGYDDLKHAVPLVCKTLHNLIRSEAGSSTPIDEILFRDAPRITMGRRLYRFHPSFDALEYAFFAQELRETGVAISCEVSVRAAHWSLDSPSTVALEKTRVRFENAVSPAASKLSVSMPSPETGHDQPVVLTVEGGNGGAVTIGDLVRAVGQVARLSGQDLLDFGVHAVLRWDTRRQVVVDGVPQIYGDFLWKGQV